MFKLLLDNVFFGSIKIFVAVIVSIVLLLILISCSGYRHLKLQINSDMELQEFLDEAIEKFNQPAMAAALVINDDISYSAVSGTNIYQGDNEINLDSRFHIGSTTKSMTSLLIAMLIDEGLINYDSTLEEVLPEIDMLPDYKQVTLHDILLNKAGILPFQNTDREDPKIVNKLLSEIPKSYPDPKRQREEVTKLALNLKPVAEPGTTAIYSNVGWSILGYIAEIITDTPYEKLLRKKIFEPLNMNFTKIGGWPASINEPNQPRGHYVLKNGNIGPQPIDDEYVLPDWMNPSGGVHLSILDYAKYAKEHLLGIRGKGILLNQSGYHNIHSIQANIDKKKMYQGEGSRGNVTMGYGWIVLPMDKKNNFLSAADGSGGTFYARIILIPSMEIAFVGFSNCGNGNIALNFLGKKILGLNLGG